jgi:hypothetical protein
MTPQEISEMHMARLIGVRMEYDEKIDQAFQEKLEKYPSSRAQEIAAAREAETEELRSADLRDDQDFLGLVEQAITDLLREKTLEDRSEASGHSVTEIALDLGDQALEACWKDYEARSAKRDALQEKVDKDAVRSLKREAINEMRQHTAKETPSSTPDGILMEGRANAPRGVMQTDPSARLINEAPPMDGLTGKKAQEEYQTLYDTATKATRDYVDHLSREAQLKKQEEINSFANRDVWEQRVTKKAEQLSKKPAPALTMGAKGRPSGMNKNLRGRAEYAVKQAHRNSLLATDLDTAKLCMDSLRSDPNNLSPAKARPAELDHRANSPEERSAAFARVENRIERERTLSKEFDKAR